jgi:hypothetical protein
MKRLRAELVALKDAIWTAMRRWQALLLQSAGALAVGAAFCCLLLIPESHAWEVAISITLWPALIVLALWLQVVVFRKMQGAVAGQRLTLIFAVPLLLLWVAIWAVAWIYLAHLSDNFSEYASYLNSRLPAAGRAMLTYERLFGLMDDLYFFVQWWLLPGILLPCIVETVTGGVGLRHWRRACGVWSGWMWWLSIILFKWITVVTTRHMLVWWPRQTASAELVNAFSRIGTIFLVDALLWYLLLSLLAAYLLPKAPVAPAGTPEESQERTAENP